MIAELARDVPLIGAMTTRNFDEVLESCARGRRLEPTDAEHRGVVERGVRKRAPCTSWWDVPSWCFIAFRRRRSGRRRGFAL